VVFKIEIEVKSMRKDDSGKICLFENSVHNNIFLEKYKTQKRKILRVVDTKSL